MKTQRLVIGLTLINIVILVSSLFGASQPGTLRRAGVVRASAFELVDEQGRVRAELRVCREDPGFKMPDGTRGYPETVLLRLITSKNSPNVKLAATEDGAGLVIGGESGYVQILSRGTNGPLVKVVNRDGREEMVTRK